MTSPLPPADQRTALQAVTAAAVADLAQEWATLDTADAVATKAVLLDLIPALAEQYGAAAGELALDVYRTLRDDAGITSDYVEKVASDVGKLDEWVRWSVDPLFSAEPDPATALEKVSGSLQKSVADQYRETVIGTTLEDAAADGWQRTTRGDGCPFCVLLSSRGFVYSEATVDFGAHTNCHCLAVPAFGGLPKPVKGFEPSARNITQAQRAATYRYMRAHGLLSGETRRPKTSRRS